MFFPGMMWPKASWFHCVDDVPWWSYTLKPIIEFLFQIHGHLGKILFPNI